MLCVQAVALAIAKQSLIDPLRKIMMNAEIKRRLFLQGVGSLAGTAAIGACCLAGLAIHGARPRKRSTRVRYRGGLHDALDNVLADLAAHVLADPG